MIVNILNKLLIADSYTVSSYLTVYESKGELKHGYHQNDHVVYSLFLIKFSEPYNDMVLSVIILSSLVFLLTV